MGSLVDDLLLLARLDQGRPLRARAGRLDAVADDAVARRPGRRARPAIDAASRRRSQSRATSDRLRQVVANLLGQRPGPHARRAPRSRCASGRPGTGGRARGGRRRPGLEPDVAPRSSSASTGPTRPVPATAAAAAWAWPSWPPWPRPTAAGSASTPRPGAGARFVVDLPRSDEDQRRLGHLRMEVEDDPVPHRLVPALRRHDRRRLLRRQSV